MLKYHRGGCAGTIIDPKLIALYAIKTLASSIILVHNHPSGEVQPSNADKEITNKVKNILQITDTNLVDHLIIGDEKYYSFCDEGIL
jgi:DNA repair protein RadC